MYSKVVTVKLEEMATADLVKNEFRLAGFIILSLLLISLAPQPGYASKLPRENQIRKAVNKLSFLTYQRKENLTMSIYKGAQDGLLDFSSEIGTKNLLKVLNSREFTPREKTRFITKYQQAIEENLPLFLVTKTSIRMFKTGAPFNTVLSTINKQIDLLRKIRQYLDRNKTPLYLTYKNKATLIDILADSIVTFSRQQTGDDAGITSSKIEEFEQTLYNTVKFSTLPVTLQGASGVKGSSGSEKSNPQLAKFLRDKATIKELAKLSQEFS